MISIALDGPAGAGKSSLAKSVAKELDFIYVDTGALYRTVGLYFIRQGIGTDLNCDIEENLKKIRVDIKFVDNRQHVFLNCEDVSDEIRTPLASMMASAVSAKPPVRAFLLEMQRKLARENNVIMDGRDIGTVVLPHATLKFFVTATAEERANRRYKELVEKGEKVEWKDVYATPRSSIASPGATRALVRRGTSTPSAVNDPSAAKRTVTPRDAGRTCSPSSAICRKSKNGHLTSFAGTGTGSE